MTDLSRRRFLRGLIAMPAVVVAANIMPVRSIARLIEAPSRSHTIFVHQRMFDDLLAYIDHFNGGLIPVTGVDPKLLGGAVAFDPWDGDLRCVIRDGVLGLDWPAQGVRIERVELLDVDAPGIWPERTEKYADAAHTPMFGDYLGISKVRKAHRLLRQNGEIGEFSGIRLVK